MRYSSRPRMLLACQVKEAFYHICTDRDPIFLQCYAKGETNWCNGHTWKVLEWLEEKTESYFEDLFGPRDPQDDRFPRWFDQTSTKKKKLKKEDTKCFVNFCDFYFLANNDTGFRTLSGNARSRGKNGGRLGKYRKLWKMSTEAVWHCVILLKSIERFQRQKRKIPSNKDKQKVRSAY